MCPHDGEGRESAEAAEAREPRFDGAVRSVDPFQGTVIELNALLGRGTHYEGKLYFEGQIRLEGKFKGSIRGDGVLVIAETAEVDADVEVSSCIVVGGTLRGNVRASESIELHVPSVVTGDLHAPNVFIDRGVQFEGSCKMAPLDDLGSEHPVEDGARDHG